jgi:hypothetical protein
VDGTRFDELVKSIAGRQNRRVIIRRGLVVVGSAVATIIRRAGSGEAAARCRSGGNICRKNGDCCSGACGPSDATGRQRCACTTAETAACCSGGLCVPGGTLCCYGICAPNDVHNCGSCGNQCNAGETCCKPIVAPAGSTDRECADLRTSSTHCGSCGTHCSPTCDFDGSPLPNGQLCCGGSCVANDVNNCNACGSACPTGPFAHASVRCEPRCTNQAGGCFFSCDAGYEDCNNDYTDGCETPVPALSDGSCGTDLCGRQPCASGTHCVACGNSGAGICCPAGQKCGVDAEGMCGACVPDVPSQPSCTIDPTRSGHFIR